MKVEDLQIGDWVEVIQNGNPTYAQVQMIDGYKGNSTENECVCGALYYNIDELKPIEITPEILEKNFDYGRGIGWYDVYFVREDEYDENYFVTKYIAIRDAHRYPKKARFTVIRDNEDNVLFEVKYVHELQHALKLCGIEKEIIL